MNIYIGPAAVFSSKQYSKFFFFFSCNFCAARIVGGKNIKKRKEKKKNKKPVTRQNKMLQPLCNMTGSSGSPLNLTTLEQSAKKTEVRRERNVLTKLFGISIGR